MLKQAYEAGVKQAMIDAGLVKESSSRIMKELLKLAPEARAAAVKKLPAHLRSNASYKLLGREAAGSAARVSNAGGHGAQHIFDVTRTAQKFTKDMPQAVRQRATLGSLLHDVGRETEGVIQKRMGKDLFNQTPSAWHSELGGRYTKQFLQRNKAYARNVPGMNKGRLSGTVRAHDTDAWGAYPWLEKRVSQDPATAATYLADKTQGLGRTGAERTVAMANKFKETPAQTWNVAQKNLGKYDNAINRFATPSQQQMLRPQLGEYRSQMQHYRQTGALPGLQQKAASLEKSAMGAHDLKRILGLVGKESPEAVARMVRNLSTRSPNTAAELIPAIFSLPMHERRAAIEFLAKYLPDLKTLL